jgi:hypothetical protein
MWNQRALDGGASWRNRASVSSILIIAAGSTAVPGTGEREHNQSDRYQPEDPMNHYCAQSCIIAGRSDNVLNLIAPPSKIL